MAFHQAISNAIQYDLDGRVPTEIVPHQCIYVSTPGNTTITLAGIFYKLQGVTTNEFTHVDFTHASPGRITYTGTVFGRHIKLESILSLTSDSNNILVKMRLAKNGVTIASSEQTMKKGAGTDTNQISMHTITHADPNDYFEIFITCDSAGAVISATSGTLIATGI